VSLGTPVLKVGKMGEMVWVYASPKSLNIAKLAFMGALPLAKLISFVA